MSLTDGVHITKSDNFLDPFEAKRTSFLPVQRCEAKEAVLSNPHANCLVLVWPPGAKPMAAEALDAFEQRRNGLSRVVYWGEGGGGCHADDDFHKALEDNWTLRRESPVIKDGV